VSNGDSELLAIRNRDNANRAILFVHGFGGDKSGTWGKFPMFLGAEPCLFDWDVYSMGYSTSLTPDVKKVWAADPDLPILAEEFGDWLNIEPLSRYNRFAILAHSMGGLIVQHALVNDKSLRDRVDHFYMFGTPSAGLEKAKLGSFWKASIENMAKGSDFITTLREKWDEEIGSTPDFGFASIAGTRDQFVPRESSVDLFSDTQRRFINGNHLEIVKPKTKDTRAVNLIRGFMCPPGDSTTLKGSDPITTKPSAEKQPISEETVTEKIIVDRALELDQDGKRDESKALLEKYQHLGTDVQGVLAGRIKRDWLDDRAAMGLAKQARELYQNALNEALTDPVDSDQVYYQAINVAFLDFCASDDEDSARKNAQIALEHCEKSEASMWNEATRAEANLYLGRTGEALDLYRNVVISEPETWQLSSAGEQAVNIAEKMGDPHLSMELANIFNGDTRVPNKIFISYSHKDSGWKDRIEEMFAVDQRFGGLEVWSDSRIEAGEEWESQIKFAMTECSAVLLLVSASFFASDFIMDKEWPVLLDAAKKMRLALLWVCISDAPYERTDLAKYQAVLDPKRPLNTLNDSELPTAIKKIVEKTREAAKA
jgi:pimeloyl-ACP methyl ester carboxylesterase